MKYMQFFFLSGALLVAQPALKADNSRLNAVVLQFLTTSEKRATSMAKPKTIVQNQQQTETEERITLFEYLGIQAHDAYDSLKTRIKSLCNAAMPKARDFTTGLKALGVTIFCLVTF